MSNEYQYLNLVRGVRQSDAMRPDRTGTGTQAVFGRQIRFDLARGFPLLTTKKVHLKAIIHELLWMLAGDSNNNYLADHGVKIWADWALKDETALTLEQRCQLYVQQHGQKELAVLLLGVDASQEEQAHERLDTAGVPRMARGEDHGKLGPVYGAQWRKWRTHRWVSETRERGIGELLEEVVKVPGTTQLAADLFGLLTVQKGEWASAKMLHDKYPQMELLKRLEEAGVATMVTEQRLKEEEIDQIAELLHNLKTKPFSRRHVISAWNVADLADERVSPHANAANGRMALSPCHALFQFYVDYRPIEQVREEAGEALVAEFNEFVTTLPKPTDETDWKTAIALNDAMYKFYEDRGVRTKRLSCQLYQRSADLMLGVPFNIASYALLTMMLAQVTGMVPGDFVHTFGDLHIYVNHFKGAAEQLNREPKAWPTMWINPEVKDLFGFKYEDFRLEGYDSHPKIDFEISV